MFIRVEKDVRRGRFHVRFFLDAFAEEEVYILARYGPISVALPRAEFLHGTRTDPGYGYVLVELQELPQFDFHFPDPEPANDFAEKVVGLVKEKLDSFVAKTNAFVGNPIFEVRVGQEIKRINEGARKALDKESEEYKEVVEKNREAFEKLSHL